MMADVDEMPEFHDDFVVEDDQMQEVQTSLPQIHLPHEILDDAVFLAYRSCLVSLASMPPPPKTCSSCASPVKMKEEHVGTAFIMTWVSQYSKIYIKHGSKYQINRENN